MEEPDDKLNEKKRQEPHATDLFNGETAFTAYRADVQKGDRRTWQYSDDWEKTKMVYFPCPRCGRVLGLRSSEVNISVGGTCRVESTGTYQSVWCRRHHLWVCLKGHRKGGPR